MRKLVGVALLVILGCPVGTQSQTGTARVVITEPGFNNRISGEVAADAILSGDEDLLHELLAICETTESVPMADWLRLKDGECGALRFLSSVNVYTNACVTNVDCATAAAAVASRVGGVDNNTRGTRGYCEATIDEMLMTINCGESNP